MNSYVKLILLCLFIVVSTPIKVDAWEISDDFNDGEFTTNTTWVSISGFYLWSATTGTLTHTQTAWDYIVLTPAFTTYSYINWSAKLNGGSLAIYYISSDAGNPSYHGLYTYSDNSGTLYVTYYSYGIQRFQESISHVINTSWHNYSFKKDSNENMTFIIDNTVIWSKTYIDAPIPKNIPMYVMVQAYSNVEVDNIITGDGKLDLLETTSLITATGMLFVVIYILYKELVR